MIYENIVRGRLIAGKSELIDKHTASFVSHPSTSARYLPDLLNRIEKIAGSVWHQLPDKADGVHSRFEVFRQRIGIKPGMGKVALASIAESLVPAVVAGIHFLEDVAAAEGFDDPDAIDALEVAVFERKIRPTLCAESDIDVTTLKYTSRSLYLRSLIEKAVSDLA